MENKYSSNRKGKSQPSELGKVQLTSRNVQEIQLENLNFGDITLIERENGTLFLGYYGGHTKLDTERIEVNLIHPFRIYSKSPPKNGHVSLPIVITAYKDAVRLDPKAIKRKVTDRGFDFDKYTLKQFYPIDGLLQELIF